MHWNVCLTLVLEKWYKYQQNHCNRFYSIGSLGQKDLVSYLGTHALMYEYYRQAQEIVPDDISKVLHRLFTSDAYQIVNTRYVFIQLLFILSSQLNWTQLENCKWSTYYFIVLCKSWKMLPSMLIWRKEEGILKAR